MSTNYTGAELIAAERQRQITAEGWTPEHDDQHAHGELSAAADSYRIYTDKLLEFGDKLPACFIPKQWPWERQWWKPSKDPVRNLVKAGALYQAQADYCRRHNKPDECEIAEQFCVRFMAEKIDRLQSASRPAIDGACPRDGSDCEAAGNGTRCCGERETTDPRLIGE